ncbi:MAG: cupin domain-containing protein [Bacteroidetes bacterium]|nr:cupin domain-containing protein [Bacteroidota bacterium]
MNIVSKESPLKHYQWGNQCDGWNFVEEDALSVKLESMPSGTEEVLHYHQHAQQFFFILRGEAAFEVEGKIILVREREGINIKPKEKHRIMNGSNAVLEFILCSQPSAQHDRHNIV